MTLFGPSVTASAQLGERGKGRIADRRENAGGYPEGEVTLRASAAQNDGGEGRAMEVSPEFRQDMHGTGMRDRRKDKSGSCEANLLI